MCFTLPPEKWESDFLFLYFSSIYLSLFPCLDPETSSVLSNSRQPVNSVEMPCVHSLLVFMVFGEADWLCWPWSERSAQHFKEESREEDNKNVFT
jgi:hypothetical protein